MGLTEDRDTLRRGPSTLRNIGVAAGAHIFGGANIMKNAAGFAVPASADSTLLPLGRASFEVDNTAGQNGDLAVDYEEGEFLYDNSADADEITVADLEEVCFVVDDGTVAKTNDGGNRPQAGYVKGVDQNGVWVKIMGPIGAGTGLAAANNLSDVAAAATARANIAANKLALELQVTDLVGGDAKVYRVVSPVAGTIKKIYSVLEVHAIAGADATLTGKIGAAAITNGVVTIALAGSAIGDVDVATPTALNVVVIGDVISVTVGGGNTDATATARVTVYIEY